MDTIKNGKNIDPDGLGEWSGLLSLDARGIYGTDIYVLWSDICQKNTSKMLALLRSVQLGFLNESVLKEAAHRQDRSGATLLDISTLCDKVKEALPNFNLTL